MSTMTSEFDFQHMPGYLHITVLCNNHSPKCTVSELGAWDRQTVRSDGRVAGFSQCCFYAAPIWAGYNKGLWKNLPFSASVSTC